MPLINCPKCNKPDVSDMGKCPACGCNVAFELNLIKQENILLCPDCNTEYNLKSVDKHCEKCGFPAFAFAALKKRCREGKCPVCGKGILYQTDYCYDCGYKPSKK